MSKDKQIISIQIPTELYSKLKSSAEADCTNVSAFIRKVLVDYYKENK